MFVNIENISMIAIYLHVINKISIPNSVHRWFHAEQNKANYILPYWVIFKKQEFRWRPQNPRWRPFTGHLIPQYEIKKLKKSY